MADNLARSPDIPEFDTYPAPTRTEDLLIDASHELPPPPRENAELNEAAEKIGSAVGRAVEMVRDLPGRLENLKDRFEVIRGGASSRALSGQARQMANDARQRIRQSRARVSRFTQEKPLEALLVVAAAAFVAGGLLRIWRSRA